MPAVCHKRALPLVTLASETQNFNSNMLPISPSFQVNQPLQSNGSNVPHAMKKCKIKWDPASSVCTPMLVVKDRFATHTSGRERPTYKPLNGIRSRRQQKTTVNVPLLMHQHHKLAYTSHEVLKIQTGGRIHIPKAVHLFN